jgi:hypothetical protein
MEKHLLSKSTFIRSVQCLKSLYLHKRRPFLRDRLSAEQLAKFRRGTNIGILAQQLFPGGINLQPKSPAQYRKAVKETSEYLSKNKDQIIYEASFQSDQILVILDILVEIEGKTYAYEVKSSKVISQTYLQDAALQYYVINNSGIKLEDFYIIYVNEDIDTENWEALNEVDASKIFIKKSVIEDVLELQPFIQSHIPKAKEVLFLKHSPEIDVGPHCQSPYPCDFIGHCWKNIKKNSEV